MKTIAIAVVSQRDIESLVSQHVNLPDNGQPWNGKHCNRVHHLYHLMGDVLFAHGPGESIKDK